MNNQKNRVTLAGAIGNLLEWYDFGLYGLLAPVLATAFFPNQNRIVSLLAVYGGFASGFAMRPIGAVVLGRLGDRVGRRFVMVVSVFLMGLATVAVGLLPTYQAIGIWAPTLLILTRLFQGFSVGGEFVGSVTYLVESAAPRRRGIAGSIANLGATAGMLLAAAAAAIATYWTGSAHATGWAWRVPFLLGGVMATAAYYLRKGLPEIAPPSGPSTKTAEKAPLRLAIRRQPGTLLATLLFTSGYGVIDYVTMVFLPTYAHEFGHVSEHVALRINTAGQGLALLVVPLAGWMSDRWISRRTILAASCLAEALLAWQAFEVAGRSGVGGLWLAQMIFALLLALVMGTAPAMLAEQFRPEYRVSAHAVAFNIGIGMVGGTAPLVAVALIGATSNSMAPAVYLILASLVSAASVLLLRDRSRVPLD
jgi:MFS transporter, MHS family, proline/betaine transporter